MLFVIMAQDSENSLEKRKAVREKHIARLNELKDENRLIIAGPNPILGTDEFSGSVVIAEFENEEQAQNWASDDPYFYSGAYEKVVVKPFKKVLP